METPTLSAPGVKPRSATLSAATGARLREAARVAFRRFDTLLREVCTLPA